MNHPTIPGEASELLDWWLPRVRDIFELRLRSVVLFGSAAIGGYTPGRSDVDVCTVVDGGVPAELAEAITQVHDGMREHFVVHNAGCQGFRYVIEGHYIPVAIVTESRAVGDCFVAWGRTRKWGRGNPITPFDRYSLSHHGIRVFGQDLSFAPPSRAELAGQLRLDLNSLMSPPPECLRSASWLASMIVWAARSVIFWRDGRLVTKSAALEHEISGGSPFADAFALAVCQREREADGQPTDEVFTEQLRSRFLEMACPAAAQLRELAADALPFALDVQPW